jgi:hypothetical protein
MSDDGDYFCWHQRWSRKGIEGKFFGPGPYCIGCGGLIMTPENTKHLSPPPTPYEEYQEKLLELVKQSVELTETMKYIQSECSHEEHNERNQCVECGLFHYDKD